MQEIMENEETAGAKCARCYPDFTRVSRLVLASEFVPVCSKCGFNVSRSDRL